MHAGPADLDRVRAEGAELAQVELALRVEAAGAPRAIGGKDAIGSDQRAAPPLAHDEVVTEWIEVVAVEAARAVWDAGAELVGEHAVTQPLAFLDLAVARREARAELGGADQAAVAASSAPWLGMLHTPPYRHAGWRPRREAVNGA